MEEINKFLTEAMGDCWHDWKVVEDTPPFRIYDCWKCDETQMNPRDGTDFLTWEGFGKLWEWATKQSWWNDFMFYQETFSDDRSHCWISSENIKGFVHRERFAKAVADYLQKK